MKYKILLTGKNSSVIDAFFMQMDDNFEAVTTSVRFEDISRHIDYVSPDVFAYCIYNEPRDAISQMSSVKFRLSEQKIPFILIGSKEECEEFERIAVNVSDLILQKPLTAASIQERLLRYLHEHHIHTKTASSPQAAVPQTAAPLEAAIERKRVSSIDREALERRLAAVNEAVRRRHILVIDDDPMMLKIIKEHLRDRYDIATAVNGKVAMKFLEHKKTDLILLDYEMPEENGPAVLAKLHADASTKDVPVIFLTGISEREKIQKAIELKPQGYLLKPIDREKLLEAIAKIIG